MQYIVKRMCPICLDVSEVTNCRKQNIKRFCDVCARKNRPRKRLFNKSGYVQFGQRYLHRICWEKHFGKIPGGYVVHHKNHIRHDNRIENLEIFPKKKHDSIHAKDFWTKVRNGSVPKPFQPRKLMFSKKILAHVFARKKSFRATGAYFNVPHNTIKRHLIEFGII